MDFKPIQLTKQIGISYKEFAYSNPDIQYCWSVETQSSNSEPIEYRIIPDGSIDIIFQANEGNISKPFISAPYTKLVKIKLPNNTKYIGVRFKPGKFRKYVDLDLMGINQDFTNFKRADYKDLNDFFASLNANTYNPLTKYNNDLNSLMFSSLSQRQKRRIFQQSTGFTLREFKKIMNLQNSLSNKIADNFYDQSHKIKTFRDLLGMTPKELQKFL